MVKRKKRETCKEKRKVGTWFNYKMTADARARMTHGNRMTSRHFKIQNLGLEIFPELAPYSLRSTFLGYGRCAVEIKGLIR